MTLNTKPKFLKTNVVPRHRGGCYRSVKIYPKRLQSLISGSPKNTLACWSHLHESSLTSHCLPATSSIASTSQSPSRSRAPRSKIGILFLLRWEGRVYARIWAGFLLKARMITDTQASGNAVFGAEPFEVYL